MTTKKLLPSRGQALVETALGIMVMGAIFIAAQHFSEIGMIGLKVEEAAAAANWNATQGGMYMHHWPKDDPEPFDQTAPLIAAGVADAQSRYADFNGLSSVTGGTTYGQMYTDASNMTVTCAGHQAPRGGRGVQEGDFGDLMMDTVYPTQAGEDNNGVACSAEATVNANAFFPHWFFDRGPTQTGFATAVTAWAATNLKVCAFGRPSSGTCNGRTSMMLDDWAGEAGNETGQCLILQNPATSVGCSLTPGDGDRFHEAAKRMYTAATFADVAEAPIGSGLAFSEVGWSPITSGWLPGVQDEGAFFLSAAGEETAMIQPTIPLAWQWPIGFPFLFGQHYRAGGYGTSPGAPYPASTMVDYTASFIGRQPCFMGQSCD